MDKFEYNALLACVRSIRRLLIYILAALFGLLCFAIINLEHPPLVWILLYPVILIVIVLVEYRMTRNQQRELELRDSNAGDESSRTRNR